MNPSTNVATLQEPSWVRALTKEAITKESTTKPQAKGKKSLVREPEQRFLEAVRTSSLFQIRNDRIVGFGAVPSCGSRWDS
jgi:hypothetical protein